MIIANFNGKHKEKTVYGLWQYDYGQVLRIQGLNLPTAVEVHFSLSEKGGESVTRIGNTKDGVTDVVIPESLLENNDISADYNAYVFIYLTDETSGQTVYKITMEVTSRPRPEAFDRPEDAELFREAIQAVNDSAERAENAAESAQDNAEQTEEDARKTAEDRAEIEYMIKTVEGITEEVKIVETYKMQAEKASSNAINAAGSANQAAKSAIEGAQSAVEASESAKESAQSAKEAELSASESAKSAIEGAESARQGAESAKDSAGSAKESATSASESAHSASESAQSALEGAESAKQAKGYAEQALQYKNDAETAQTSAQQSAQEAKGYSESAKESEGNALLHAEGIKASVEQIKKNTADIAEIKEGGASGGDCIPIINTESGQTPLIIKDSAERPIRDLKLYGKSEQGENPTPDNPQEIVNDGRYNEETGQYEIDVKVTGKNLFDVEFLRRTQKSWLKVSYYYLPIKVKKGSKISFSIRDILPLRLPFYVLLNKEKGTANNAYVWLYHSTGVNLINQKGSFIATADEIYLSFAVSQVQTEIDSLFEHIFDSLQIEINEEPTPYEPYKEQYIAITSDRPISKFDKLEKRDGVYGWVYSGVLDTDVRFSRTEMFPYGLSLYKDHGNGVYTYALSNVKKETGYQTSLCEQFANNDGSYNKSDLWNYSDHPSLERQYFNTAFPTGDEFMQWVEENPLTMLYKSKETEFIPLSEEEQRLLSELSTYYPTTVISNSDNTDMEVSYVADTKNYVDDKIRELSDTVTAKVNYLIDLYANEPVVIPEKNKYHEK